MLRAAGCVEIEPGDILTCYDADYRPLATVIVGEGHRVEFEANFDGIITFVQVSPADGSMPVLASTYVPVTAGSTVCIERQVWIQRAHMAPYRSLPPATPQSQPRFQPASGRMVIVGLLLVILGIQLAQFLSDR